jgi:hypothetical protein
MIISKGHSLNDQKQCFSFWLPWSSFSITLFQNVLDIAEMQLYTADMEK